MQPGLGAQCHPAMPSGYFDISTNHYTARRFLMLFYIALDKTNASPRSAVCGFGLVCATYETEKRVHQVPLKIVPPAVHSCRCAPNGASNRPQQKMSSLFPFAYIPQLDAVSAS